MLVVDGIGLSELSLRLVAAVFLGGLLGLNRDFHHKPAGMRTLSLVSLGAAMVILVVLDAQVPGDTVNLDAISRVLQGILTGIGFLGIGVIIKDSAGHVSGLTTAATIWVSAILGTLCGLGCWNLIGVSTVLILSVLTFGGRLERAIERLFKREAMPPEQ